MDSQGQEVVISSFKGMVREALYPWLEKAPPEYALEAYDVVFDLYGTVYSNYGWKSLSTQISSMANVSTVYYSSTFDRILVLEGSNLKVIHPTTGALVTTLASGTTGFSSGDQLTFAEWPRTASVYVSNGSTYRKLSSGGTACSAALSSSGNATVLISHKGRVWAGKDTLISISDPGDPEVFSAGGSLRLDEDGAPITSAWILDGILFFGKVTNVWFVVGDSSDDFFKRYLNIGRGPVGKYAVFSYERKSYFVAKDGLFSFTVENPENISKTLSCDLGLRLDNPPNTAQVRPLVPVWPPDQGRRYILFAFQPSSSNRPELWRFDVDTLDWTRLCYFNAFDVKFIEFDSLNSRTYICVSSQNQINRWDFVADYGGATITGVYTTHQINCGIPQSPKNFGQFNMLPTTDVPNRTADIDGMGNYGFNLSAIQAQYSSSDSLYPADNRMSGYMTSLRSVITGGLKQLMSGFALMYETVEAGLGRSYAASRLDIQRTLLNFQVTANDGFLGASNAAIALYSEVAGLSGSQWTLTHNLSLVPPAIINTFSRELAEINSGSGNIKSNPSSIISYTKDAIVCRSGFSDTESITGTFSPLSGTRNRQQMLILKSPLAQVSESLFAGGIVKIPNGSSSTITVRHGMGTAPTAIFLQRDLIGATGLAGTTPGFKLANITALSFDIQLSGAASAEMNLHWIAIVQGANETLFKCGSATTSTTGADVSALFNHGLTATPRHVIVGEDFAGSWRPMYVTDLSATQFGIRYNSLSNFSFYWAVFTSPGGGSLFDEIVFVIV